MKISYSSHFKRNYKSLSNEIKSKFTKQIVYLLNNINHPSLRVKKYDEQFNIWQARVDKKYRFYFLIENDMYILLSIRKHPK